MLVNEIDIEGVAMNVPRGTSNITYNYIPS